MSNNTVRKIHIVYKEGHRRKVNVSPYQQPPVVVYPGEDEMQALAFGCLRILRGEETARTYVRAE